MLCSLLVSVLTLFNYPSSSARRSSLSPRSPLPAVPHETLRSPSRNVTLSNLARGWAATPFWGPCGPAPGAGRCKLLAQIRRRGRVKPVSGAPRQKRHGAQTAPSVAQTRRIVTRTLRERPARGASEHAGRMTPAGSVPYLCAGKSNETGFGSRNMTSIHSLFMNIQSQSMNMTDLAQLWPTCSSVFHTALEVSAS